MTTLIASVILRGLSGVVYADVSSAYVSSSGRVCDIYPVSSQEVDLEADLGEWGQVFWCGWTVSALHDRQRDLHRMAFFEFETMLHYRYEWNVTRDCTVRASAGAYWDPQIGYPDDSNAYYGPQTILSFENPYVTPYVDYVNILDPVVLARARLGLRRAFACAEQWRTTPSVETVWSDSNRCKAMFGEVNDYKFCDGAFTALAVRIKTEWLFAEQWSVFVLLGYLMTLGDKAREAINNQQAYWAKCDWLYATIGCAYSF